jgi:hypothetical protein
MNSTSTAVHPTKLNQVFHVDYLFISKADAKTHNGFDYVLVLMDLVISNQLRKIPNKYSTESQ